MNITDVLWKKLSEIKQNIVNKQNATASSENYINNEDFYAEEMIKVIAVLSAYTDLNWIPGGLLCTLINDELKDLVNKFCYTFPKHIQINVPHSTLRNKRLCELFVDTFMEFWNQCELNFEETLNDDFKQKSKEEQGREMFKDLLRFHSSLTLMKINFSFIKEVEIDFGYILNLQHLPEIKQLLADGISQERNRKRNNALRSLIDEKNNPMLEQIDFLQKQLIKFGILTPETIAKRLNVYDMMKRKKERDRKLKTGIEEIDPFLIKAIDTITCRLVMFYVSCESYLNTATSSKAIDWKSIFNIEFDDENEAGKTPEEFITKIFSLTQDNIEQCRKHCQLAIASAKHRGYVKTKETEDKSTIECPDYEIISCKKNPENIPQPPITGDSEYEYPTIWKVMHMIEEVQKMLGIDEKASLSDVFSRIGEFEFNFIREVIGMLRDEVKRDKRDKRDMSDDN